MVGAYFGFKKQPVEHPVRTNQIPRQATPPRPRPLPAPSMVDVPGPCVTACVCGGGQVPAQPWFVNHVVSICVGGVLPFGAVFVEVAARPPAAARTHTHTSTRTRTHPHTLSHIQTHARTCIHTHSHPHTPPTHLHRACGVWAGREQRALARAALIATIPTRLCLRQRRRWRLAAAMPRDGIRAGRRRDGAALACGRAVCGAGIGLRPASESERWGPSLRC